MSMPLHARAAELTADPVQAMLHRLRAVPGHDAGLAAEAVSLATSHNTDGKALAQARLLTGAAELLPPGTDRTQALVTAADILLSLGEARWVATILTTVDAETPGERGAHELLVRGHLAVQLGDGTGSGLIAQAWELSEDAQVSVGAAELLAFGGLDVGDAEATGLWAEAGGRFCPTRNGESGLCEHDARCELGVARRPRCGPGRVGTAAAAFRRDR